MPCKIMQSRDALFIVSSSCFLLLFFFAHIPIPFPNIICSHVCSSSEWTWNSNCSRGSSFHSPLRCKAKSTTGISGVQAFQSEVKVSQIIWQCYKKNPEQQKQKKPPKQNQATIKKKQQIFASIPLLLWCSWEVKMQTYIEALYEGFPQHLLKKQCSWLQPSSNTGRDLIKWEQLGRLLFHLFPVDISPWLL